MDINKEKAIELKTVSNFLELCIPSLSPIQFNNLVDVLNQLLKNRHIPSSYDEILEEIKNG